MKLLTVFSLLVSSFLWAQEDTMQWKLEFTYPISPSATWYVLSSNKIIVAEKDQLQQLDTNGVVLFQQSIKNSGTISQIDGSNKLKTLLFSTEQQLVNFVDNTLTKQQASIDLSTYNLSYVSLVCASMQNDRFWTFDQDNSTIMLITSIQQQNQRIENVGGLLGITKPISMQEQDNKLYLLDEKKGLFVFDNFGTFVQLWDIKNAISVDVEAEYAYFVVNNELLILDFKSDQRTRISMPIEAVLEIQKTKEAFYFRTKTGLWKYKVEFLQK
jgi:hypothetical protein